jgi:hypothetical protein
MARAHNRQGVLQRVAVAAATFATLQLNPEYSGRMIRR